MQGLSAGFAVSRVFIVRDIALTGVYVFDEQEEAVHAGGAPRTAVLAPVRRVRRAREGDRGRIATVP